MTERGFDMVGPPTWKEAVRGQASASLFDNAQAFLNEGLNLLFASNTSKNTWKIAVVAIQTAVELFAKFRLVSECGLEAFVLGNTTYSDFQSGSFRSLGFGKVIEKLEDVEIFDEDDLDIIREVQELRNKLVHFSIETTPQKANLNCLTLLVRALTLFADRHHWNSGEMSDYRRFLTEDNYSRLIFSEDYRAEAYDFASGKLDYSDIFRCWHCENETLGYFDSENYYCFCCGFSINSDSVGFTKCAHCGHRDGVYFDSLNLTAGFHFGKCGYCENKQFVYNCLACEGFQAVTDMSSIERCLNCSNE
ncbi:hypothetical protein IB245_12030 [Pseudomonas sp. PDM02]|uniref:hypothetical protein n=1 Tax=Pseudomonas sp. PDM02 TaxID=2769267 RepID=UPI001784FE5E|nr:hypothetical protein [Pseudomonas sp. PDM02]MBD9612230.1 hypothetical protein [Pseudomonas sp. PDM02]